VRHGAGHPRNFQIKLTKLTRQFVSTASRRIVAVPRAGP